MQKKHAQCEAWFTSSISNFSPLVLTLILLSPSSSNSKFLKWFTFSMREILLAHRNSFLRLDRPSKFSIFLIRLNDISRTLKKKKMAIRNRTLALLYKLHVHIFIYKFSMIRSISVSGQNIYSTQNRWYWKGSTTASVAYVITVSVIACIISCLLWSLWVTDWDRADAGTLVRWKC